jgi:tetratricopeptide (TPR) repeat protein
VWIVLVLALGLRFFYLIDLRHTPFFESPQMDALYHDQWARRVAEGHLSPGTVFFRAPLYPTFLGVLYLLTGADAVAVRVIQFLIGAGTALLTTLFAYRRFSRLAAIISGLFVALHGPLIYFEGELLLVVLEAPLFLVATWSLDRALNRPGWGPWVLAGAFAGIAALVRPTILALYPVLLLYLLLKRRRGAFLPGALYGAALLLAISPALIHNYVVGRDFVPIASQGGLNFYLGNNPAADGMSAIAPQFRRTWTGGLEDATRQAELARGRALRPSEVSRYWFEQSMDWARSDPGAFIALEARKLALFWDAFEIPNNQDYYYFSRLSRLFRIPLPFGFGLLAPLALSGLVVGLYRRRFPFAWVVVPAILMVVICLFFVCGRFRAPLVPLFSVWAGVGVSLFLRDFLKRRRSHYLVYAALVLGSGFLLNADFLGLRRAHTTAESNLRLGIHYAAAGDPARAIAYTKAAVRVNPRFADGWNNLGTLYAGRGNRGEARRSFDTALWLVPDHPKALANRARLAFEEGETALADSLARRALRTAGREPDALMNAGTVLGNLGDHAAAQRAFAAILRLVPGHGPALLGNAKALSRLGRTGEAMRLLQGVPEERRTPEMNQLLREWESAP